MGKLNHAEPALAVARQDLGDRCGGKLLVTACSVIHPGSLSRFAGLNRMHPAYRLRYIGWRRFYQPPSRKKEGRSVARPFCRSEMRYVRGFRAAGSQKSHFFSASCESPANLHASGFTLGRHRRSYSHAGPAVDGADGTQPVAGGGGLSQWLPLSPDIKAR